MTVGRESERGRDALRDRTLNSKEQNIVQRVFLRLVSPADSGEYTRRRAAFTALPPEGADLVDKLADARYSMADSLARSGPLRCNYPALLLQHWHW
jgi:hypothetical protein